MELMEHYGTDFEKLAHVIQHDLQESDLYLKMSRWVNGGK